MAEFARNLLRAGARGFGQSRIDRKLPEAVARAVGVHLVHKVLRKGGRKARSGRGREKIAVGGIVAISLCVRSAGQRECKGRQHGKQTPFAFMHWYPSKVMNAEHAHANRIPPARRRGQRRWQEMALVSSARQAFLKNT